MTERSQPPAKPIETVLVCYTQASFDALEKRSADPQEEEEPAEEVARTRYIATLAERLTAGLQAAGCTAETVRVPQRSFVPRDITKAAFAWRMLDLKESNGRPIDLALCLDFPAWSLQHPRKYIWLTALPNFVTRSRVTLPSPHQGGARPVEADYATVLRLKRDDRQTEQAQAVAALLQAERRGLSEAYRLLAGSRPVAEELSRRGLQVEFNPLPADLKSDPSGPQWQAPLRRLLEIGNHPKPPQA